MRSISDAVCLALVVGALVASCSVTKHAQDDCSSPADCRMAFGLGWTCGGDGLCVKAPRNARCTVTFPDDLLVRPEQYSDVRIVGCIADESLDTQRFRERSVGLALAQVNESAALPEHRFGVICCSSAQDSMLDGLDNVQAAVADARYLVDEMGAQAIVGPSRSEEVEAVFAAVGRQGALVISPSATSPALTALEPDASDAMPGLLWRTAPPDSLQARVIVRDMVMRGVLRVAVIAEAGSYGDGLSDAFSTAFAGAGGATTIFRFDTAAVRDSTVTDVASGPYTDVLFVSSATTDSIAFLRAASVQAGYASKGIFLSDGAANQDLLTMAADASALFPRVRLSRPAAPSGVVYDAFASAYVAAYGVDEVRNRSFTAHAFDAAWLVFYGTAWASAQEPRVDGRTIASGLRHLSSGAAFDVRAASWSPVIEAFVRGEGVDLNGASGAIDYDPVTEETSGPIEVLAIDMAGTGFVVADTVSP